MGGHVGEDRADDGIRVVHHRSWSSRHIRSADLNGRTVTMCGMGDRFRTDGGATWLNLLATRGQSFGARPVERLPDVASARDWLTLVGLPPAEDPTESDRDELVALREALRELAMAAVEQRPPHEQARASVTATAGAAGDGALSPSAEPVSCALARASIAVQALVSVRGPDRASLKECAESDCRWVFLDPSSRRRWCPAPACASRGRVRAHRAAASSSG
ncbi:CGNR zinc finger domain-containing protein [Cellulomonas hominis]|uniref:CGNR zinc finger domain-containing protein n=1 Tax=Cellulomonas hominis TaxID=156981 RepID=UPI001BD12FEF|nr:CGNR zinc finger domain-containing protein [Cellulomonas hominis]